MHFLYIVNRNEMVRLLVEPLKRTEICVYDYRSVNVIEMKHEYYQDHKKTMIIVVNRKL